MSNNANNMLLFGKWSTDDVKCDDIALQPYISINNNKNVPHSSTNWSSKKFKKATCPVVERLANTLMMHGRNGGKKLMVSRHIEAAFEIINLTTGKNPIQVLVDAIVQSAVREDSTRIGKGGQIRRQSVDVAPYRRVNQALFLIGYGARKNAFRKTKTFAECLADELIAAASGAEKSYAVQKKNELERVAASNR